MGDVRSCFNWRVEASRKWPPHASSRSSRSEQTSDPPCRSACVYLYRTVQAAQYPSYLSAINVFVRFIVTLHASLPASNTPFGPFSAGKLFQFVPVSHLLAPREFAWLLILLQTFFLGRISAGNRRPGVDVRDDISTDRVSLPLPGRIARSRLRWLRWFISSNWITRLSGTREIS